MFFWLHWGGLTNPNGDYWFYLKLVARVPEVRSLDISKGYDLIDGYDKTVISFQPTPGGKKSTPQPNYSTVTDLARFLG